MKIKKLKREILLKASIDDVWSFFTNPHNLPKITPPKLSLKITSDTESDIYAGQIITYTVSPLPLIKMEWLTEIKQLEKNSFFIDEQRIGPYSLWHHQHSFIETDEGVLVSDLVHYALPFYPISEIAHILFVKKELKEIFDYREKVISSLVIGE